LFDWNCSSQEYMFYFSYFNQVVTQNHSWEQNLRFEWENKINIFIKHTNSFDHFFLRKSKNFNNFNSTYCLFFKLVSAKNDNGIVLQDNNLIQKLVSRFRWGQVWKGSQEHLQNLLQSSFLFHWWWSIKQIIIWQVKTTT